MGTDIKYKFITNDINNVKDCCEALSKYILKYNSAPLYTGHLKSAGIIGDLNIYCDGKPMEFIKIVQ